MYLFYQDKRGLYIFQSHSACKMKIEWKRIQTFFLIHFSIQLLLLGPSGTKVCSKHTVNLYILNVTLIFNLLSKFRFRSFFSLENGGSTGAIVTRHGMICSQINENHSYIIHTDFSQLHFSSSIFRKKKRVNDIQIILRTFL